MLKEKNNTEHINEEGFAKVLSMFRGIPSEKQMFALAFVNGMEFQKNISRGERIEPKLLALAEEENQ